MRTVSASIGVNLNDSQKSKKRTERRYFIGGSDAHIIMGNDEPALLRLWREKRGEIEPEDLSGNLVIQLGVATEDLNRRWYQANTGQVLTDVQWPNPASGAALDGGHVGWSCRSYRCCVRGQVHAALVVLRRGRGRKIHAAAAAQYVGGGGQVGGALCDYRRRQMGRDHHACRSALSTPDRYGGAEVLALCRAWRAPSPLRR